MPLDIAEFDAIPADANGSYMAVGKMPPRVVQTPVAISGVSAQSAALAADTRFVRLHADVACRIEVGPNPIATANSIRMAAGQTEYFGVYGGHKIAVISTT
jgi:hypothetical protein